MKVIQADYSMQSKTVGLLEDSVDELSWMDWWLNEREPGNRPYQLKVTVFEHHSEIPELGSAMVYAVALGENKVVRPYEDV
jgi:hypothetical protein